MIDFSSTGSTIGLFQYDHSRINKRDKMFIILHSWFDTSGGFEKHVDGNKVVDLLFTGFITLEMCG